MPFSAAASGKFQSFSLSWRRRLENFNFFLFFWRRRLGNFNFFLSLDGLGWKLFGFRRATTSIFSKMFLKKSLSFEKFSKKEEKMKIDPNSSKY
jgi:hypothetical protein